MENPSNQESEPKKGDFWLFGNFFWKTTEKYEKSKFEIFLILFASKCLKTPVSQNLWLFSPFEPLCRGIAPKGAIFGHFWWFSSVANLPGMVPPKSAFRTWFGKFGSNPEDWDHKNGIFIGKTHLKGSKRVF